MEVTIPKAAFNPLFYPYLQEEEHRYLVLYGGAGSGKSVFAVQQFLYRLLTQPLCNLLVVRAVAATNRDSTYALFRQMIGKWGLSRLFSCRDSDLRITCANGNSVVFKGLDDAEKLKSITFSKGELTEIWVEEASEISEGDFNQLDVRLRGRGTHKQIVLTFNPVSVRHWLKRRFFDRKEPRAVVVKSTYRDNNFLDEDYKHTLESYKDTDPYYYAVYCFGAWGVLGQTIFDAQKVSQQLARFSGARSVEKEKGSGSASPSWSCILEKSTLRAFILGGVPVLKRRSERPRPRRRSESGPEGASPSGPESRSTSPTMVRPRRKVPVATTAARQRHTAPVCVVTETTRPFSTPMSTTSAWMSRRRSCRSSASFMTSW